MQQNYSLTTSYSTDIQ